MLTKAELKAAPPEAWNQWRISAPVNIGLSLVAVRKSPRAAHASNGREFWPPSSKRGAGTTGKTRRRWRGEMVALGEPGQSRRTTTVAGWILPIASTPRPIRTTCRPLRAPKPATSLLSRNLSWGQLEGRSVSQPKTQLRGTLKHHFPRLPENQRNLFTMGKGHAFAVTVGTPMAKGTAWHASTAAATGSVITNAAPEPKW
ncbi:uncharacterized protein LOC123379527 [Felis catus]|uniref:uncharacterized protein LOC123379527 n=1 Tax=Felis catus TaxID=9685 RepID=UPI001D19D49A|nr:uncharacterized protein LOC123379527 [Felis catus]